ncbi:MAG: type III pantothenate kinase [Bacteroidetes bacterium]|nr:type III pantothenate kinase [Bacteroidota bacterium]
MNLIADIGNTAVKIALFENGEMAFSSRLAGFDELLIFLLQPGKRYDKAIISTVRDIPGNVLIEIGARSGYLHRLSHKSSFPFSIDYETPETLGMDRLAAVAGAYNTNPHGNVLVIDAGTAVTFDVLSKNAYKGGTISPGIDMRFRALNSFTGKLPLVEKDDNAGFPGRNTREAINSGVIFGIVFEINEYIREFNKNHSGTEVVLTGGDAPFLSGKVSEKHRVDPALVMHGLNFILEYNA